MKSTSSLARRVVENLEPVVPGATEPFDPHALHLRNNENPYGGLYRRYPGFSNDGVAGLSESYLDVIRFIEQEHDAAPLHLQTSNISLSLGAASALEQVFKAFFEPCVDRVALTPPCFGVFSRLASIYRIETIAAPLLGPAYDRLNVDELCASNAKGVVLCDPNNPIGSRLHPADIERLLARFSGLVVVDEAYVEYSRQRSNLRHLQVFPRLIILRTLSKALGMAGLRLGAAIGHEEVIEPLRRVQLPFAISSASAGAAQAILARPERIMKAIQQFRVERDRFHDALAALPCVASIWGHDCGFICIRTDRFKAVMNALRADRIEPVFCPERLPDCVRMSIGTTCQNDRVIRALEHIE
jgi:histidinol-phosphate aminotransferase